MSKLNTSLCIITGNLTRDAELKYTPSNLALLTFTVAVNRFGANNESATDYFQVNYWGKPAEAIAKYLTKGKSVLVRGQMRSRSYENKEGRKVTVWDLTADNFGGIELLGSAERQNAQPQQQAQPQQRQRQQRESWNPLEVEAPNVKDTAQGDMPF